MNRISCILFFVLMSSCSLVDDNTRPLATYQSDSTNGTPVAIINHYDSVPQGYFFLTTYKMGKYDLWEKCYRMILDEKGRIMYSKQAKMCFDLKLQPNGLISYFEGDKFWFMNNRFEVVDSVACVNGVKTDLHDMQVLKSGHYLLIGKESREMTLPPKYARRYGVETAVIQAGVIQELDKDKQLVFTWNAADHFDFGDVDNFFMGDTLNTDWTHFNAVEEDYDGNLLLTVRNFNEITKIRKSDGRILWRLGGKRSQFRFINTRMPLLAMHDARRIDNGNITLYDNGHSSSLKRHPLRAMEIKLNEKKKTAHVEWSYIRNTFSKGRGNVQKIDSNRYLVNLGEIKNKNLTLEMISSSGKKLLDLKFADTLGAYRAFFYTDLPWDTGGLQR